MGLRLAILLAMGPVFGQITSPWIRPQAYKIASTPFLPTAGVSNRLAFVTDCENASTCTTGGGSTVWLFRDSGLAWAAAHPIGGGGGGMADPGANGMLARTALNTTVARTLTAGSTKVSITNGTGVSGNPTIDVTEANLTLSALGGAVTDSQVPNNITVDLATAATALAANPTDCSANQFATTIAANGNLTCAALADGDIPAAIARDSEVAAAYQPLDADLTTIGGLAKTDDNVMVANGSTWELKALPDCSNATTSKLLYNITTNAFSCGTDQTSAGGGITSLGGQTGGTQTFTSPDDTNVVLTITSGTDNHEFAMSWSGTLAKSRQHAATVYNDAGNTFSAGAQDFGSATSLKIPTSAGAAPTANGLIAYDSTANAFEGGVNGVTKAFAMTDGNIATATALAANGANCSGSIPRGVDASGAAEGCANIDLTTEVIGTLPAGNLPAASTSASGIAEAAIDSEVTTGTDAARYVTPDALAGSTIFGTKTVQVEIFPPGTAATTGDGKTYFYVPPSLNGMNLVGVRAQVYTAGTTGTINIDIDRCVAAASGNVCSSTVADMLSTNLTIDSGENASDTAAAAAAINGSNDDVATGQVLRFNVDAIHTTPSQGLLLILTFQLP